LLRARHCGRFSLAIELEILTQELDADVTRALSRRSDHGRDVRNRVSGVRNRRADRERQLALLYEIGSFLDDVVRKPLTHTLVRSRAVRRTPPGSAICRNSSSAVSWRSSRCTARASSSTSCAIASSTRSRSLLAGEPQADRRGHE
jgi:hypothetical protein